MFVSHDKNVSKRKFQKPNILRRKTRVPLPRSPVTVDSYESPNVKSLVTTTFVDKQLDVDEVQNRLTKQVVVKQKIEKPNQHVNKIAKKVISTTIISGDNGVTLSKRVNKKENDITFALITPQPNNNQNNYIQNNVNVESFIVGGEEKQKENTFKNTEVQFESIDQYDNTKWCLDVMQDSHKVMKEHYKGFQESNVLLEQKLDVVSTMVPLSVISSMQRKNIITIQEEMLQNNTKNLCNQFDDLNKNITSFKCDAANCDKEFSSNQKLKKHRSSHNKEGSTRPPRQTTVECPINKNLQSGVEEPCGRKFILREDLLKHLNEEHTLEQANHICAECGRRFFWACGLRAHGRAHGRAHVRGVLACAWPGCGRVFRQPCRLREHTRAHTGDKPYPCKFPNCGWSFRTASKLMRHARRHTGERRHACSACGRAFLRREHLREHHARHHSPRARATHACAHDGCQQSFNNMSSLYMHMKKVHKKETCTENAITLAAASIMDTPEENTFTVSLLKENPAQYSNIAKVEVDENVRIEAVVKSDMETEAAAEIISEAVGEAAAGGELGAEEHAARTHCTWPLPPRVNCGYEICDDAYVLEEDVQVEQSESSENIYTIRSDLFLHGNVLTNDDNESISGGVVSTSGGVLGDDLGLLDTHPTIDLMQEELMYTDASDESSFRVFLLSGEDLT